MIENKVVRLIDLEAKVASAEEALETLLKRRRKLYDELLAVLRGSGIETLDTNAGTLCAAIGDGGEDIVAVTLPSVASPTGAVSSVAGSLKPVPWMQIMRQRIGGSTTPVIELPFKELPDNEFEVFSQTRADSSYRVTVEDGEWTCSCPYFTYKGVECKHIRSVRARKQ